MANIITSRKSANYGRTRSEQEANIRKDWGPTLTDEQLDKIKFVEKQAKELTGSKENFVTPMNTDNI